MKEPPEKSQSTVVDCLRRLCTALIGDWSSSVFGSSPPLAAWEMGMLGIDDVVTRMQAIEARLPADDGVACFNRMYLQVTELVRARVADGFFDDPQFMARLDVVFAGLYFAAVDDAEAERKVAPPWEPLFARRDAIRIRPIQFALAGMNAHINHDLALAVFLTCAETGIPPSRVHGDYLRINQILASVEEPVRLSFLSGVAAAVNRELDPVIHLVDSWSIDRARDAAWANAEALWTMRTLDGVRASFLEALARMVGFAGRALLIPSVAVSRGRT
jgi:hypothetical protein